MELGTNATIVLVAAIVAITFIVSLGRLKK